MEIQVNGGGISQKVDWARKKMEQSIPVSSVFAMDENIDIIGVTKGKGVKGKNCSVLSPCGHLNFGVSSGRGC